jgi:hypothetical protein
VSSHDKYCHRTWTRDANPEIAPYRVKLTGTPFQRRHFFGAVVRGNRSRFSALRTRSSPAPIGSIRHGQT